MPGSQQMPYKHGTDESISASDCASHQLTSKSEPAFNSDSRLERLPQKNAGNRSCRLRTGGRKASQESSVTLRVSVVRLESLGRHRPAVHLHPGPLGRGVEMCPRPV